MFELLFLALVLAVGIALTISGHRDEARNR